MLISSCLNWLYRGEIHKKLTPDEKRSVEERANLKKDEEIDWEVSQVLEEEQVIGGSFLPCLGASALGCVFLESIDKEKFSDIVIKAIGIPSALAALWGLYVIVRGNPLVREKLEKLLSNRKREDRQVTVTIGGREFPVYIRFTGESTALFDLMRDREQKRKEMQAALEEMSKKS